MAGSWAKQRRERRPEIFSVQEFPFANADGKKECCSVSTRSGQCDFTGAFALPLVVFTKMSEMLFDLDAEVSESGFTGGGEMLAFLGCVERAGGKSQGKREAELFCSRQNGKYAVKLHEIGIKTFQKPG